MIIPTDDPRAVAAVGAIHAGATWPLAEFPGSPQALLAAPAAWYAAATDEGGTTGIYRSGDAGRNWELYYRDPPDAGSAWRRSCKRGFGGLAKGVARSRPPEAGRG